VLLLLLLQLLLLIAATDYCCWLWVDSSRFGLLDNFAVEGPPALGIDNIPVGQVEKNTSTWRRYATPIFYILF
jgi:hypothetical protein